MNLKHRLSNKTTATVKFITETQAIYSDEVTTNIDCLHILEAETKQALWDIIKLRAQTEASTTKFKPVINVITPNKELKVIHLPALQPTITEECPY